MIYLIQPKSSFLIEDRWVPNWGLLYIREYIRSFGLDCEMLEIDTLDQIPLDGEKYGISSTTAQFCETIKISRFLKENTSAKIVGGGPHITALPELSQKEADFDEIIVGEGERKFLGHIAKISINELDSFPFPKISKEEILKYGQYNQKKSINVMTSRGCPFNCSFCADKVIWGRKVRNHSIKYVQNMLMCYKLLGFESIRIMDDTFALNKKRMLEVGKFCKKINLKWQCQSRADEIDNELVDIMLDNGCTEVAIGIESGDQKILDLSNKKTSVKFNRNALEFCYNKGMNTRSYIMLGLPGETEKSLRNTQKFMQESPTNAFTISVFCPYPGTDIWNNPQKYGVTIEYNDWSDFYSVGNVVAAKSLIKEMKPLQSLFEEIAMSVVERSTFGKATK